MGCSVGGWCFAAINIIIIIIIIIITYFHHLYFPA